MQRISNPEQGIYEISSDDSFFSVFAFRLLLAYRQLKHKLARLFAGGQAQNPMKRSHT
jgi:hypothetical protein